MGRRLRAGLDREMRVQAVCVAAQLGARAQHRMVDFAVLVFRYDADMRRDDFGAELDREVEDTLGLLDLRRVRVLVLEAVAAKIADKRGYFQSRRRDERFPFLARR